MNRETPRRFATSMSVNVVLPDGFANDATNFTPPLDSMVCHDCLRIGFS